MSPLPVPLSIVIWLTAALWAVALLAYIFDAPAGVVWLALFFGTATGMIEWLAHKRKDR